KFQSRSSKVGLQFPVGRIPPSSACRPGAPGTLASLIDQLLTCLLSQYTSLPSFATETLKLAGNTVHENKQHCIVARHLPVAIGNDEELGKLHCRC
ncbi:hypothetical protein DFH07DRAFT_726255, partial [Mycena maculata]